MCAWPDQALDGRERAAAAIETRAQALSDNAAAQAADTGRQRAALQQQQQQYT